MKINKFTFWISLLISFITLVISITFTIKGNGDVVTYLCNLSENVLAGTIIMIMTSAYAYKQEKVEIIEGILEDIGKTQRLFNNLKYYDPRTNNTGELKKRIDDYIRLNDKLEEIFQNSSDLYGKLSFMTEIKKFNKFDKKRIYIYNNYYKQLKILYRKLNNIVNDYFNTDIDIKIKLEKMLDFQNDIFVVIERRMHK